MQRRFTLSQLSSYAITILTVCVAGSACSDSGDTGDVEVGCRLNSDCSEGELCQAGECVEDEGACNGEDCPCRSDGDCGTGEGCELETGECFGLDCLVASDCVLGQTCQLGRCITDVDSDRDRDGVPDIEDLCPEEPNADQEDNDSDGLGDACDADDDDDGRSDTTDNCPLVFNPAQGDANSDGIGNACDEAVQGTTVKGQLNFSAGGDPDTSLAQVFISGRVTPVGVDAGGAFVIEQALSEQARFVLRVEWPGFQTFLQEFEAPLDALEYDVGELVLRSEAQDAEQAALMSGQALLQDQDEHTDIVVRARIGDALVETTLTDDTGRFSLRASRVDHTLSFSKENFVTATLVVTWNREGSRFEVNGLALEEAEPVVLLPDRSASVSGRLVSPIEGFDFSGSTLTMLGRIRLPVPIQPSGDFGLGALAADDYILSIEVEGHAQVNRLVEIRSGSNEFGDIEVTPTPVQLLGRVELEGQEAQGGVIARLRHEGTLVATTLSDEVGLCVFEVIPRDYTLSLNKAGFLPLEVDVRHEAQRFFIDETPVEDAVLTLRPDLSAALEGQLASDSLEVADWSDQTRSVALLVEGERIPIDVLPDGVFVQERGIAPGSYILDIDARAHGRMLRPVTLRGGTNDLGTITLIAELGQENAAVQMRGVATLAGQPDHSGIVIRALIGNNLVSITTTDSVGNFLLDTARSDHTLEFSHPGFETTTIEVIRSDLNDRFEVLGEPLTDFEGIVLQPDLSASLTGLLVTAIEPFDFAGASVTLVADARLPLVVQPDGRFGQGALSPGLYGLEIEVEGHRSVTLLTTLRAGSNDLGQIALEPLEVTMTGRVQLGGQETHEDVTVRLRREGVLLDTTVTDESGIFVFQVLPLDYSLSFTKTNFLGETRQVEFVGGEFTIDTEALTETQVVLTLLREPLSDRDADGVIDVLDNCPDDFNADQRNIDGDGPGDACDEDADGDGLVNGLDNCPFSHNPMQEDPDGDGRGVTCSDGTIEDPFSLLCGVVGQNLDTRERPSVLNGSCGGVGSPEVIYQLGIGQGEGVSIQVDAQHPVVLYLLDAQGREMGCVVGGRLSIPEDIEVPSGDYRLVVDGFSSPESAGPIAVDIQVDACGLSFLPQAFFEVGTTAFQGALGDVDGDGHLDIVTGNVNSQDISVLLGDGQGSFAPQQRIPLGILPNAIELADLNDDGHLDLITAAFVDPVMMVLLGDGQGGFGEPAIFSVGINCSAILARDLNGDGLLDLVVTNAGEDNMMVFVGDGEGGFAAQEPLDIGDRPHALEMGDLNGDGLLDVVTANLNSNDLSVLVGNGQGAFAPLEPLPVGNSPRDVALGDVSGDGLMDIVVANSSNSVGILRGDGQGSFAPQESLFVDHNPLALTLGDLNGDGHLDIITANESDNSVSVLTGDGRGAFEALSFPAGSAFFRGPRFVMLGDVDEDGRLDIVTVNNGESVVSVLRSDSRNTLAPQVTFPTATNPKAAVVGDVTGDGLLDVVAVNPNSDEVSLFVGDGRGALSEAQTFPVGDAPNALVLEDVNEDGLLDVVTLNLVTLSVLLADGQGSFEPQIISGSTIGQSLALGDVNEDGHLDAIVGTTSSFFRVALHLGDGQGRFGLPNAQFPVDIAPRSVLLEDLNSDGHLDAITANNGAGTVSVLLGNGQGGFATHTPFPVIAAFDVAVGDVNQDGKLDIVAGSPASVSLLLGDGQGGFAPRVSFPTRADSVALGDVDGDGFLDIVAANTVDGRLGVLHGDGQGDFAPEVSLPVGDFPLSVELGDLNRDGRLDVITANFSSNDVSILLARVGLLEVGTRKTNNDLPPCASVTSTGQAQPGVGLAFDFDNEIPCRIDRLELELAFEPGVSGHATLFSPSGSVQSLVRSAQPRPGPGLWRPEIVARLARLESHPLTGRWRLETGFELDGATMVINRFPEDPFGSESPAPVCVVGEDQPAEVDFVCRLEGEGLDGLLVDDDDEDVFLLEGDFDGAFIQGQELTLTVETAPGSALLVELRAFRARTPVAIAEEVEPGLWALTFTVPSDYSNRHFAVHLRGAGVANLAYNLQLH